MSEKAPQAKLLEGLFISAICLSAFLISIWPNLVFMCALCLILIATLLFRLSSIISNSRFSVGAWGGVVITTAVIGSFSAYQSTNAIPKLINIILALLIAVYISKVNSQSKWTISTLALAPVFFSFAFALTKLNILNPGVLLTPNRLAGLSAIFVPFLVLAYLNTSNLALKGCLFAFGLIATTGLLLSGSRGAIGAILLGHLIWYLVTYKSQSGRQSYFFIGQTLFFAIITVGITSFLLIDWIQGSLITQMPGADSRIELYANSIHLVRDFWVVGGGLNSFGGLYSQYIVSVPFLLFTYGHNLYLDLLLEQGILGLLSVLSILIGSIIVGFRFLKSLNENRHLVGAAIASVCILLFHGFIDDAVYGDLGSPLIFISSAIIFKLCKPHIKAEFLPIHTSAGLVLLMAVAFFHPVISAQSNLLSIQMAKIQLERWPTNEWSKGGHAALLSPLATGYKQLISNHPYHVPSHYHLGLIEIESRNFVQAEESLESAYAQSPNHLGISKNLGLTKIWVGEYDDAIKLLKNIPGIDGEIDAYIWWWAEQGDQELSDRASHLKNDPSWAKK